MENIACSFATDKDIAAIKTLLHENQLPYEDIDEHINNFIVAKEHGIVIGTIGLELLMPYSLLRSLSVHPKHRNKGTATELLKRIIEYAYSIGITELFLFTTTAEEYFAKKEFEILKRNGLPEKIKSTQEFISLCPDTAICMNKKIMF
jgi:amino-acid N-acetyltransferase